MIVSLLFIYKSSVWTSRFHIFNSYVDNNWPWMRTLPHTILSNLPANIISAYTLQYLFPCCLQKSIACGV